MLCTEQSHMLTWNVLRTCWQTSLSSFRPLRSGSAAGIPPEADSRYFWQKPPPTAQTEQKQPQKMSALLSVFHLALWVIVRPWWAQKRALCRNLLMTRVTSVVKREKHASTTFATWDRFVVPNLIFQVSKQTPHLQATHRECYRETLPTNWLHPHRQWLVGTLRALVGISVGKDSFCCTNNEPKHASKLCENYSRAKENQGILDISPTVTWPDPCRTFTIWGTDCAVPYFLLYILLQWWILMF